MEASTPAAVASAAARSSPTLLSRDLPTLSVAPDKALRRLADWDFARAVRSPRAWAKKRCSAAASSSSSSPAICAALAANSSASFRSSGGSSSNSPAFSAALRATSFTVSAAVCAVSGTASPIFGAVFFAVSTSSISWAFASSATFDASPGRISVFFAAVAATFFMSSWVSAICAFSAACCSCASCTHRNPMPWILVVLALVRSWNCLVILSAVLMATA
mmetsp:Transcript_27885/g.72164  ORF Transcript_27885/g.72164 Transcript_27885/m.72164 type:complete len:219 (-) Transcript_27885:1165-1821(-)